VCPTARYAANEEPRAASRSFRRRSPSACGGFNARSSFGAHAYFVARPSGNLLVDSPRFATELVKWFERAGGLAHVILSHRDDVADADKYAERFGARVWIHRDDRAAAPYATDFLEGESAHPIAPGLVAIPVPGHTRGSVVYLLDDRVLFAGDSLAWSLREQDLIAFRDACWYSWSALTASLAKLADYRFEWLLPGDGWPAHLIADEMNARLRALVARMRAA
jgi:glyoxylase-like metal-dependent hydrolase (beta-lactamase superfamily II)